MHGMSTIHTETRRSTIFVIGPSRGGTSLTTAVIHASGAFGVFDHTAHWNSDYSEFETQAVLSVNTVAMAAYHQYWNAMPLEENHQGGVCYAPLLHLRQGNDGPPVASNWSNVLITQAYNTWRRLRAKTPPGQPLVLKDPRFGWTLGLWVEALKRANEEPAMVLVVRSPIAAARSLACRERAWMDPLRRWEGMMRLSLNSTLDALPATKRCSNYHEHNYTTRQFSHCTGVLLAREADLWASPTATLAVRHLIRGLSDAGVQGLSEPSPAALHRVITLRNATAADEPPLIKYAGRVLGCDESENTTLLDVTCPNKTSWRNECTSVLSMAQIQLARALSDAQDESGLPSFGSLWSQLKSAPTPHQYCYLASTGHVRPSRVEVPLVFSSTYHPHG